MATASDGRIIRLNCVSNRPASPGNNDDDDDEDTGNVNDDNSRKWVSKDAPNEQISLFKTV